VILGVSFRPPEFNRDLCEKETIAFHLLSDVDRAVMKRYGVWNEKDDCAQRVTFLIDKEGVIRRVERKVEPATHGKDLIDLVDARKSGMLLYGALCLRCHGEDGKSDSYPNVKRLDGIGNRLADDKLWAATIANGLVDVSSLTEKDRQALIVFVSGL